MRVATWAIQDRERAVARAAQRLGRRAGTPPADLLALLDVVSRALVARLNGAALHDGTLSELRARYAAARLTGAAHAVAGELRDLTDRHSKDEAVRAAERRAISDATDDVVAALDPDGAVPIEFDEGPRPTLLHAISEFATRPLPSAEAPRPPRALLRMRAHSAAAARALTGAATDAVRIGGVTLEPAAPDEVLCSTWRDGADGVTRLVRLCAEVAGTPALPALELSSAIVVCGAEPVDAAVVAAALLTPGVLRFDEPTWRHMAERAAAVPGQERTLDPRAPFSTDRLEQSALLMRPGFTGRDEEVAALSQWLLAPTARAGLAVLHGPAGIGKTSLLRAALAGAGYDDEDAPVLWGTADAGVPVPYAAVSAMLRAAAHAPATSAAARPRVERTLALLAEHLPTAERADLRGGVAALLAVLGERDEDEPRGPRALRLALRRAFVLLVRALWERAGAARPVVIVVTHADAIDGATREVIELCGEQLLGRLRVVFVTALKPRIAPSLERTFALRLSELGPLPPAALHDLVSQMLAAPVDEELAALLTRTKGNPLAAIHAVRLIVESGWLRPRDGFIAQPAAREIPTRLEKLLALRVQRLSAEHRRLLSVCALLGPTFSLAAAELIGVRMGLSHDDVLHALTLLVDTGSLVRLERRPARPLFAVLREEAESPAYGFEHPLLRAVAAQAISAAEEPAAHALVAEAFEALAPAESSALAASLARHHRLAGAPARALAPLLVAVRRSARLDDRQGAVELARDALGLCKGDAALAFPFLKELCRVREQGPRKHHLAALRDLVRCADETSDPRRRAEALLSVVRFNLRNGDAALAAEACERALSELRGLGDARLELSALRVLAVTRAELGELEQLERLHGEILARVPANDRATRAALAHLTGVTLLAAGDLAGAVERLSRALMDARAVGDPAAEASCLEALALAYGQADRPSVALELVERARVRLEAAGDAQGRARLAIVRAELLLAAGDELSALSAAERARSFAHDNDAEKTEIAASLVQARAHLARNDPFIAEPILEALRKRVREDAARAAIAAASARAKVLRAAATTGARRERILKTAIARAREALELAERAGLSPAVVMQAAAALAEALLLEGDVDAAFPHAQRAAEHVEDGPAGPWLEEALLANAHVAAAMGDDDELLEIRVRARDVLARRASHLDPEARERFYATPVRVELLGPRASPRAEGDEAA